MQGGLRLKRTDGDNVIQNPLVTVITVVLNGVDTIEDTMCSVLKVDSAKVEYIIIDGGSTDGTVQLISNYNDRVAYWISEPDKGIYDAINKGIKKAQGHFFYVLNKGDRLVNFPSAELLEATYKKADIVLFDVLLSDGRIMKSAIDYRIRFGNTIHHQGAFYRRELHLEYDLRYKVYSDFDANQKLFLQKKNFLRFNKLVSYHSLDGISNNRKYFHEYFSVIRRNFGLIWVIVGFLYIKQGKFRMNLKTLFGAKSAIKSNVR